jgi:hypothetical protein
MAGIFNVGERVRLIRRNEDDGYTVGPSLSSTGVVFDSNSSGVAVDWVGFTGGHCGAFHDGRRSCWWVDAADLERDAVDRDGRSVLDEFGTHRQ